MTDDGRLSGLSPERRELLRLLLEDAGPPAPLLRRDANASEFPLSLAQERMWVSEKLAPGGAYTTSITIEGRLEAAVLERVFDEIVRRHGILRTAHE